MKTLRKLVPGEVFMSQRLGYHKPSWTRIVALEDIARARSFGPDRCQTVATYLPDGRKILDVLDMMPEGKRKEAYMNKHGLGMVNMCYFEKGELLEDLK